MSAIFGPLPALPTYWVTYFSQRGTIFSQDAGLWFCISLICCYLSEAGKKSTVALCLSKDSCRL